MDPATLAWIIQLAKGLMIDRYANTAGATAWFYDYILTMPAEYEYIWKRKWSLVKVLYLLNRYLTPPFLILVLYHLDGEQREPLSTQVIVCSFTYSLLSTLTFTSCIIYDIIATIVRGVQLITSTWLVLIVVHTLSLNNRYMKATLYTVFIIMICVVTAFGILTLKEMFPTITYVDAFRICGSSAPASTRWLYMAQIPFDLLLLGTELFYYWRLHRMVAPVRPTKLITTMYLDGVWYFMATLSVKLGAAFLIIFADPAYWYAASSADQALTSTFVARLVLHLRAVATQSTHTTYASAYTSQGEGERGEHDSRGFKFTGPVITVTMADDDLIEDGNRADNDSLCKTNEDEDDHDRRRIGHEVEAFEMQKGSHR